MTGEINILGVFVPALLIWALVAFGLRMLVCQALLRAGFYRHVWHRPLFDTAVFVVLLGLVVWLANLLF